MHQEYILLSCIFPQATVYNIRASCICHFVLKTILEQPYGLFIQHFSFLRVVYKVNSRECLQSSINVCVACWYKVIYFTGVLGSTQRHTPAHCWTIYLYKRPEIRSHPLSTHRGLDSEDQVSTEERFWNIRVPDQHHSPYWTSRVSHRSRWVEIILFHSILVMRPRGQSANYLTHHLSLSYVIYFVVRNAVSQCYLLIQNQSKVSLK